MKINHKFLIILLSAVLFVLNSPKNTCLADEMRLGITPSFIANLKVEQGLKDERTLTIINNSIITGANSSEKGERFSINVKLRAIEYEQSKLGESTDNTTPSKWLSFSEDSFELKNNEQKDVKVFINIPENALTGEQIAMIEVTRSTNQGSAGEEGQLSFGLQFTPVIKIPVFISVIDKVTKVENLVESAEYKDIKISAFNDNNQLSFLRPMDFYRKLFSGNAQDILSLPMRFSFSFLNAYLGGYTDIIDIPQKKETTLKNVIASSEKEMNNKKYVLALKPLNQNALVKKVSFNKNEANIITPEDNFVLSFPSEGLVSKVSAQITSQATILSTEPTIGWLLDNIAVPADIKNGNLSFVASSTLINTGTKTLIPAGALEIYNISNIKTDSSTYQTTILKPGDTKEIMAVFNFDSSKHGYGKMKIRSFIQPYKNAQIRFDEKKIWITNNRLLIIFIFSLINILVLILLFIMLRMCFKFGSKIKYKYF